MRIAERGAICDYLDHAAQVWASERKEAYVEFDQHNINPKTNRP